jgi:alpha-tubulin suppressor-like RCC1 family protein
MDYIRRSRRVVRVVLIFGLLAASAAAYPAVAGASPTKTFPFNNDGAAWGANGSGQLGDGNTVSSSTYVGVSQLTNVQQISAGNSDSLAVTSDGSVWAWGSNGSGQLGTGNTISSASPQQVDGISGVTQVAAGWSHSLALRSDGTVWAWGDNTAGELGNGTSTQSLVPVPVTGLTGVVQVAAGNQWSMALRSDGTVWGWGGNQWGQLGVVDPTAIDTPVQLQGLSRVTSIAAGTFSGMAVETRGLFTILNSVVTWGQDFSGQLGNGTACLCGYPNPQPVSVNVPDVQQIAAGAQFAMVLGTDGSVWEWGDNTYGELHDQGSDSARATPFESIGPGSGITQIAAGGYFALALLSNETVEGWGDDQYGQLGNGNTEFESLAPVQVTGLTNAWQISAGGNTGLAIHAVPRIIRI